MRRGGRERVEFRARLGHRWRGVARLPLVALSIALSATGCERIAGPQAMVAGALAEASQPGAGFEVDSCGRLSLARVQFSRLLVKPEGEGMVAVATVDAEGAFVDGARVSYLGLERVPFRHEAGRWQIAGALLPALEASLSLMCRRRQALARGDRDAVEALGFSPVEARSRQAGEDRVRRWVVRVDRERVEVLEEGSIGNGRFVLKRENGALRPAPTVF